MSPDERRQFGAWLREQRRQRGLSSKAIAKKLSVHFTYVCNIERGVGLPGLDLLERWLRLFDVDLFVRIGVRDS